MLRKIILPLLAICGIMFAIFMINEGLRTPSAPPIRFKPPEPPYTHYVAGEGLIESYDQNIDISVPFPQLILHVYVNVGDKVEKNTPLFKLDTRELEAQLAAALKEIEVAKVNLQEQTTRFSFFEKLKEKCAVSQEDLALAYYAKRRTEEELQVAYANAKKIEVNIERSIIRAPCTGEVLQSNIRVGEYANVNPFNGKSLIVFGDNSLYQLRVNIAEENAWRIMPNTPATAFVRGNSSISIPLTFSHIEPYVVPKESLTGSDFERIDTRVLQVIYTFKKDLYPVYIGQLLDVYIEALPSNIS